MNSKNKLRGIISLSAASMALLQSSISVKGEPQTETTGESNGNSNGQITSKTDKLILEPPFQKELLRLYAGHSSHASHSSHVSGMGGGGVSDYSTPVIPYNPPSTPPVTYPTTPQPTPPPVVTAPIIKPVDQTNSVAVTNDVSNQAIANNQYIDFLKKDAAKGSSSSQFTLGIYYLHGEGGCETNIEKAKMLFELSAIQGNDMAKKRLKEVEAIKQVGKKE